MLGSILAFGLGLNGWSMVDGGRWPMVVVRAACRPMYGPRRRLTITIGPIYYLYADFIASSSF